MVNSMVSVFLKLKMVDELGKLFGKLFRQRINSWSCVVACSGILKSALFINTQ